MVRQQLNKRAEDIFGVSGRAMLEALLKGGNEPRGGGKPSQTQDALQDTSVSRCLAGLRKRTSSLSYADASGAGYRPAPAAH